MIPLILIGGFRDITIGADTQAYPLTSFEWAQNYVYISQFLTGEMIEPLYVLYVWLVVHFISNNFQDVLFWTNTFIIVFFYLGFYRFKKMAPMHTMVFLFCFLFFNLFLSMSRQGMAMALVFFASSFLVLNRKLIPFAIIVCISSFIHKSALLALLLIPFLYIQNKKVNKYIVITAIIIFITYSTVLKYFVSFDSLEKYSQYQVGENYEGFFSISEFIIRCVSLSSIIFCTKKIYKDKFYDSVIALFICEFFVNLLQIYSRYAGRIGYYYFSMYLVLLPHYVLKLGKSKYKRVVWTGIILLSVFFWWYVNIETQSGYTYPYSSKILRNII